MTLAGFLSPRRLSLLALIPLLCACTVDVGPSYSRPPPPPPRPAMCTMEYAPVCGQRSGRVQTFTNACQARTAGFAIINRGQCRRPTPITSRPPPPPGAARPQMCTMEYAPVCGQRGARVQTFANACQARAANFTVISRGQCRRQPGITVRPQPPAPRPAQPGGICTREYRPVCGQRGSQMRSFPNACEASNSGFRIIGQGACRR
ncbi:MAG: Kazal-type serine protease inhibitor domain-containing protein [Rhizobium sp.]|uniref:Kazal-type serine protease inhibitor domain-containing protein n=1 Tax=Rhizobium sp. TaxID=391 RepID=UPI0006476C91